MVERWELLKTINTLKAGDTITIDITKDSLSYKAFLCLQELVRLEVLSPLPELTGDDYNVMHGFELKEHMIYKKN